MAKKSLEISTLVNERYVIGVTWRSIINRGSMGALAKKRAKEETGSNYYSHFGDQKYVGAALIKNAPADGEMFSLAKIFTKRIPSFGFNLACIRLETDVYWVCVVENGVPRFDKVVRGEAEVRKVYEKYREDAIEAGVQAFGDGSVEFQDMQSVSFEDLAVGRDEECQFLPLSTKTDPRIFAAVGVLVLGGGAFFGWTYYNKIQAEKEAARRAAEEAAAALTPAQVEMTWKRQVDKFISDRKVIDHEGLNELRNVILHFPVRLGGWQTNTYTCGLSVPNWKCLATFTRAQNQEVFPTNRTLIDAKPPGWDVSFKSLNEAQVVFSFPAVTRSLSRDDLIVNSAFQVDSVAGVQTFASYFTSLTLGDAKKEKIPQPTAPSGEPIEPIKTQPSELSRYDLSINGPLRNTYLFDSKAPKVFWSSAEVKAEPSVDNSANFRRSIVSVTLKGEMYALDR